MSEILIPSAILAIYLILGTAIAVYSRRLGVKTSEEYYVGGYRLGGFLAAMTYAATTYSAFMMVGLVGLTYATGVGAFGFEITYLIATVGLLTIFAPKVLLKARERRWVSPAEMLSDIYGGRDFGLLASVIYLVSLIPYASAQLIGVGNTVAGMGGGNYLVGVLLGVAVGLLWTVIAGIWSVATTDLYQGLWMLSAALAFIAWLLTLGNSSGIPPSTVLEAVGKEGLLGLTGVWSFPVFLAYTLPWIFFAVTNPHVVQRLFMPRDIKALKSMITYFTLFGFIYTVIVTFAGLLLRGYSILGILPDVKYRDLVTPTALSLAHPLLASFVFTSIVAAAVSTMDSIVLTLSSTVSRDIYTKFLGGREEKAVTIGRLSIVAIIGVLSVFAYFRPDFIVELSVLSSALLLPLAPVTIYAWVVGGRRRGMKVWATAALLSGFAFQLTWALIHGARLSLVRQVLPGIPSTLVTLLLATGILCLGHLIGGVSKE